MTMSERDDAEAYRKPKRRQPEDDDYLTEEAIAHLLRSSANTRRLLSSIRRLEHGDGEEHDTIEPTDDA
jgi:hypothetical protein